MKSPKHFCKLFYFPILVLLLLLAKKNSINGQNKTSEFELSDYKLTDVSQQQLNLDFGLNLSDSNYNNGSPIRSNSTREGHFRPSYYFYKNNRKHQSQAHLQPFISYGTFSNDRVATTPTFQSDLDLGFEIDLQNRFYKNNKHFFEIDIIADGIFNKSRGNPYFPEPMVTDKVNTTNVSIPIGFGIGRLEAVEDARLALFILEDLEQKGKIDGEINKEDYLEFAKHISRVKWQRVLDFRMQNQYQVEAIDSFLRTKDFIKEYDAIYFTSIIDLLRYNWFPERFHGNRKSFLIAPSYLSYNKKYENYPFPGTSNRYTNENLSKFQYLGQFNFDIAKTINVKWQWDLFTTLSAGYETGKEERFEYQYNAIVTKIEVRTNLGFYPNNRTSLKLAIDANFDNDFGSENHLLLNASSSNNFTKRVINVQSSLELFYWLAPNFNITLFGSLFMRNYKNNTIINLYQLDFANDIDIFGNSNENERYIFTASLNYSIF